MGSPYPRLPWGRGLSAVAQADEEHTQWGAGCLTLEEPGA